MKFKILIKKKIKTSNKEKKVWKTQDKIKSYYSNF